jgi:hypothetical protein
MDEEDVILLAQEITRNQQPVLKVLNTISGQLENQPLRTNKSIRVSIDLSIVHTNRKLGLSNGSRFYLWLTIEKADSPFTYKLGQVDQTKSESFTGVIGARFDQHEFTEIYLTNAAAVGEAVILVGWRE